MRTAKRIAYWTFVAILGLLMGIPMLLLWLGFFATPFRG